MDEEVKICPECGAEYFPHITICRSCEVALIHPWEKKELPKGEGSLVCIEEGAYQKVAELAVELKKAGAECEVLNIASGKSCSKDGGFGLFVHQSVAREAVQMLDEITYRLYPELKEVEERMNAGLCPACGADTKNAPECPDCGLNLGGGGADECGGCGPC